MGFLQIELLVSSHIQTQSLLITMTVNSKSWKNKRNACFFPLLAMPEQHLSYSGNVYDNSDDCFLLINKTYWTAYAWWMSSNHNLQ
jgi:hypothetical protein